MRAIRAFSHVPDAEPIVWLDWSAVESASRAGIALLARFARDARRRNVTLRLIGVPPRLRGFLAGTALADFLWEPLPPAALLA